MDRFFSTRPLFVISMVYVYMLLTRKRQPMMTIDKEKLFASLKEMTAG